MDKYFLTIVILIIFSSVVILFVRISARIARNKKIDDKQVHEKNIDSIDYDNINNLANLKADDFTLLDE